MTFIAQKTHPTLPVNWGVPIHWLKASSYIANRDCTLKAELKRQEMSYASYLNCCFQKAKNKNSVDLKPI